MKFNMEQNRQRLRQMDEEHAAAYSVQMAELVVAADKLHGTVSDRRMELSAVVGKEEADAIANYVNCVCHWIITPPHIAEFWEPVKS